MKIYIAYDTADGSSYASQNKRTLCDLVVHRVPNNLKPCLGRWLEEETSYPGDEPDPYLGSIWIFEANLTE